MQAFHQLFSGKPNASTLSPELNAQIITVSEHKPNKIFKVRFLVIIQSLVWKLNCHLLSPGSVRLPAQWEWFTASARLACCHGESAHSPGEVINENSTTDSHNCAFSSPTVGPQHPCRLVCRVLWVWVTSLASFLLRCPACCHLTLRWFLQPPTH